MQELEFQDSAFDLSVSKQYKISIQASLDGFSVLVLHSESEQVHLAYYMPVTLSNTNGLVRKAAEVTDKLGFNGKAFQDVTVYLSNRPVMLIPSELYNEKTVKRTLTTQWPGSKKMTTAGMKLNDDYHLAFSFDSGLADFLSEQFPGCTIKHEMFPLLNTQLKSSARDVCSTLVHIHSGYFFITAVRENQILFFNGFEYQSPDDLVFYLASALQAIDSNKPQILLSGNIPENSTLYKRIMTFFPLARLRENNPEKLQTTGWNRDVTRFISPLISELV